MTEYISQNPATGEILREYSETKLEDLNRFVLKLHEAYRSWSQRSLTYRLNALSSLLNWTDREKRELAQSITSEMGKPLTQSLSEVEKALSLVRFYLDHAEPALASSTRSTSFGKASLEWRAKGCVLGVMPWNFPVWQAFRFIIPNLVVGNVCLLKPSPFVSGTNEILEQLFHKYLEDVLVKQCRLDHGSVALCLAKPEIVGLSFTGSSETGAHLASIAGSHLKSSVLECGGSDPYIVLEDADIELSVQECVKARFLNSGQSCLAAKRWLVHESQIPKFRVAAVDALKRLKVGDPLMDETDVGPVVRQHFLQKLLDQMQGSSPFGQLLCGGKTLQRSGFFLEPSLFELQQSRGPLFDEEVFGPVATLISFKQPEEAIRLANQSIYGLGAALFSQNKVAAEQWSRQLEAGTIFINQHVRSDPSLPMAGLKYSGYGRELSEWALFEFAHLQVRVH